MTLIRPVDELMSVSIRKRFGKNHEYGCGVYGFSDYGDFQPAGGIYRIQPLPNRKNFGNSAVYGCGVYGGTSYGESVLTNRRNIKCRYYIPTQNDKGKKLANEAKFRASIVAWKALSDEEKAVYNKRAIPHNYWGQQLFTREWMLKP